MSGSTRSNLCTSFFMPCSFLVPPVVVLEPLLAGSSVMFKSIKMTDPILSKLRKGSTLLLDLPVYL